MPDIEVLIVETAVGGGGLVRKGAGGGEQQALDAGKAVTKVVRISAERIADGVAAVAQAVGPTLRAKLISLPGLELDTVSIGCAITVDSGVIVAGVGAEASLTVTFRVS
ncbi:CU044_2847 family protein [Elioraea rosea]|uniref:CU044_2847 family protein n=1 Tax=Elioraea rosea TaxID=2492390 RepID=UPI0011830A92|nr:CU044_2847 family protein [Elioraea rosea]